jgi:hypothetical protein
MQWVGIGLMFLGIAGIAILTTALIFRRSILSTDLARSGGGLRAMFFGLDEHPGNIPGCRVVEVHCIAGKTKEGIPITKSKYYIKSL